MKILKKSNTKTHYYYIFKCNCCCSKIRFEEEEIQCNGWGDEYFYCPVCGQFNLPNFVEFHKRREKVEIK